MTRLGTVATIFVRLLDEGVDVWRPVPAIDIGNQRFRLTAPDDYDTSFETWEFPRGAVVDCETKTLSDGPALVATRLTGSQSG